MSHLSPEQLVDVADGTCAESSVPHLAACVVCRRQIDELRATISAARAADVPEPSPLFWEHFSARVRGAIDADRARPRRASWRRIALVPAALAAAAAIAFLSTWRTTDLPRVGPPSPAGVAVRGALGTPSVAGVELLLEPDASLTLVEDLASGLDSDGLADAGLAGDGSAEHAVTHMTTNELQELRRLLEEALSGNRSSTAL